MPGVNILVAHKYEILVFFLLTIELQSAYKCTPELEGLIWKKGIASHTSDSTVEGLYTHTIVSSYRVHCHAPSIWSHRGTKVVWPDFQPMRVPEEPVRSSLSTKSSFYLPAFEIPRSCRTAWVLLSVYWARICKRLWSPGIDSEASIPLAYVAWRADRTNRVVVPGARLGIDSCAT